MLSHYWFKLPTLGTPPCPRYSHHMSFLQNKSQLVIYGGKNDEVLEIGMDSVLSDIHILDLVYLCWCRVGTPSTLEKFSGGQRYSGSMIFDDFSDTLVIFGGMNEDEFISGYPKYLICDEKETQKMAYEEKLNQIKREEEQSALRLARATISSIEMP